MASFSDDNRELFAVKTFEMLRNLLENKEKIVIANAISVLEEISKNDNNIRLFDEQLVRTLILFLDDEEKEIHTMSLNTLTRVSRNKCLNSLFSSFSLILNLILL